MNSIPLEGWQKRFNRARDAESKFRFYTNRQTTLLNNESGWKIDEEGFARFWIGPNNFNSDYLEEYFSTFIGRYRSGLDHMVSSYARRHNQNLNSAEFPIRSSHEDLESRIKRWRKWDDKHKNNILNFISNHSPYAHDAFSRLQDLSKLRNIDEHRRAVVPIPHVNPQKALHIPALGGSANFGISAPKNRDFSDPWYLNDRNSVAEFNSYYGAGFKFPSEAVGTHIIYVRFEVTDSDDSNFTPIDALSFMTKTTKAIKIIENDFLQTFGNFNTP